MRLALATLLVAASVAAAGCGADGISTGDAEQWVRAHANVTGPIRCRQIRDSRELWCRTPNDRRISRVRVRANHDAFTIIRTCRRESRGFGDGFDPGYDSCTYNGFGSGGFDSDGFGSGGFDPG